MNRWSGLAVNGILLILLGSAIVYVMSYGTNVPSWDDWDMVPTMTHHQPITASWLWSQHNEHRIPLARLIMLGIYRFWTDFRVCMYWNVAAMGVMAFALTRSAKRVRGKAVVTDIVFPLVLLGFAQGLNFIWAWQVEFFASTVLALCILILIAEYKDENRIRTAVLVSICLALLVASGAHGLALVPALALWVALLAILPGRDPTRVGPHRIILLSLSAFLLLLVLLYFVGYQRVPYFPTSPSLMHTLKTALQFLTMAFGPAVKAWWLLSGVTMAAILVAAILALGITFWKNSTERARSAGFVLFICAMTSLALAVGLGRNGFEPRYVTLSAPIVCCVYFIASIYSPSPVRKYALLALVLIPCLCFWANMQSGLEYGRSLHSELGSFEESMAKGVPPYQIVHAHLRYLHPNVQLINDYLPMLRDAKVGQFRFLRANPPFQQIKVPLNPVKLWHSTWNHRTAKTSSSDAYIVFAVPVDVPAAGIQLKYTVENETRTPPFFSIAWRDGGSNSFTTDHSYYVSPTGDHANWERGSWLRIGEPETKMNLWICDRVREIQIKPDHQPCAFRLSDLALLVDETQH